jgi:putative sterol carrier protein
MTIDEMTRRLAEAGATLPGKRIKLVLRDVGTIMLDGKSGRVSNEDGDADTTLSIGWDDWIALAKGELGGASAFMQGRLRIDGDMSNALQLQSLLSGLKG